MDRERAICVARGPGCDPLALGRGTARRPPGWSSRRAPPATTARSSTAPATPWPSSATRPRRASSCCSATSTPSPAKCRCASSRRDGRDVLYGRGSVDAKGPLATFVAAGARLGAAWARAAGVRLVVVGAVEEEAASSKGARFIAERFDGARGAGASRLRHRRAQPLGSRHDRLQGPAPDRPRGAARDDPLGGPRGHRRHRRGRAVEPGRVVLRDVQRRPRQGLRSAAAQPALDQHAVGRPRGARHRVDRSAAAARVRSGAAAVRRRRVGVEPRRRARFASPIAATSRRGAATRRNALVRSFLAAIRAQGDPEAQPAFVVKTGTSDMNVVGPVWRCPILAYGPGDSRLDHTPDEHVALDEYWSAVLVLERALRGLRRRTRGARSIERALSHSTSLPPNATRPRAAAW